MTIRSDIFSEIDKEREYQDKKWGTDFDDKNTLNDWNQYIAMYCANAADIVMKYDLEYQYEQMLKAATITIAALETFKRNGKFAPRHYDTEE